MEEWKTNVPVQLFSVCSTQGEFTPRWFRYEDNEHQIQRIEVDRILSTKELTLVGIRMMQYVCVARFENQERLFELRYNITSHKWTLHRLLS